MEFDHIIQVYRDGTVTNAPSDISPPEVMDDEVQTPWRLLTGYTGQYGYRGPTMHPSEYIGGRLERDILATPGYYVALLSYSADDDAVDADIEPDGWVVAYLPSHEVEHEDETDCPDMRHCPGHRQFTA
jgi:hypothetical protein